jgi:hypothetical protein
MMMMMMMMTHTTVVDSTCDLSLSQKNEKQQQMDGRAREEKK